MVTEYKEMVGFKIPEHLKDWINQKVESGGFFTLSESLNICA